MPAVDLGQILAIGGPVSAVTAIIVVLVNAYLAGRKDKREQKSSDVQVDSGIVDNAKKVLELVRGETDRMEARISRLAAENDTQAERLRQQDLHINNQDDKLARLTRDLEFLTLDLKAARDEIARLRGVS